MEIGCANGLIWPIREDLRHFKALTMGHPVIMGRLTWESLPKRPLPGRVNVVITRNGGYEAGGAMVAESLEEALALPLLEGLPSPFVIGGGSVYAEALPMADVLHLTRIDADAPQADCWFPEIPESEWRRRDVSEVMTTPEGLSFRFETLERIAPYKGKA